MSVALDNHAYPGIALADQTQPSAMHMEQDNPSEVDEQIQEDLHTPDKPSQDEPLKAFIENKVVQKVIPDIMNWVNISGNTFSLASQLLGFSDGVKDFAKQIADIGTKAFMIATSVINIAERFYSKNFLSAFGYFNDIIVASTVGHDNTYLARGNASGTYNMANALSISNNRENFSSFADHASHLKESFGKYFKNLFSKDILKNFADSSKGMWAITGGLLANFGSSWWMLSGKTKAPTLVRDLGGVAMDVEQLNPGHLKAGRKNFFFSGVSLVIGTLCDYLGKILPGFKELLVPMTFISDGIGRHLLRLHQNEYEHTA